MSRCSLSKPTAGEVAVELGRTGPGDFGDQDQMGVAIEVKLTDTIRPADVVPAAGTECRTRSGEFLSSVAYQPEGA